MNKYEYNLPTWNMLNVYNFEKKNVDLFILIRWNELICVSEFQKDTQIQQKRMSIFNITFSYVYSCTYIFAYICTHKVMLILI